jgi:ribosomal protein S12 methylthiotransferase
MTYKMRESVCLVTLGCPKNVVEGESIAGLLSFSGWDLTTDIYKTDIAVVHTCSFINDAKSESISVIANLLKLKKKGVLKRVIVTGCMVQSDKDLLLRRFPGIDGFVGTGRLEMLPEVIRKRKKLLTGGPGGILESNYPRLISTNTASTYLRIAEGCNHKCAYCLIPSIRGSYKSRAMKSLFEETCQLAEEGIKEVMLISQDTSAYGADIYGKPSLTQLLKRIEKASGIEWIRILYTYPSHEILKIADFIAKSGKACKYLDIPVQHVSRNVLKLMQRPLDTAEIVLKIKDRYPDISLRTTFIAGFPGESERDFTEICDFMEKGIFDHVGVFEYSAVQGVKSKDYKNQVPDRVKKQRKNDILTRQLAVVNSRNKKRIGRVLNVLVDKMSGRNRYSGHAEFQAPEVDGKIEVKGKCRTGHFARVKVTGYNDHDLKGEKVN